MGAKEFGGEEKRPVERDFSKGAWKGGGRGEIGGKTQFTKLRLTFPED